MIETVVRRSDEKVEHYRDRLRHLTDVIDGASADRELAMFRAYQLGVVPEQIAVWAAVDVCDVRLVIESMGREAESEEWADGPYYLQVNRPLDKNLALRAQEKGGDRGVDDQ